MTSKTILTVLVGFLACIQLQAQELKKDVVEKGLKDGQYEMFIPGLGKAFPNSKFIIPSKEINYSFELNDKTQKVEVIRKEEIQYYTYNTSGEGYRNIENLITKDLNTEILYVKKDRLANNSLSLSYSDLEIGSIFYHDIKASKVTTTVGRFVQSGYYAGSRSRALYTGKKILDVRYLTKEFFVDQLPILKQTVTFDIPEWLDISIKEYNTGAIQFERTEESKKNSTLVKYVGYALAGYDKSGHTEEGAFIYPHLLVIPNFYTTGGRMHKLFDDVDGLYNWYKKLVDDIDQDPSVFKEVVSSLTKDKSSDIEKIKAIYYWVQDNIRYVAYEDGIAGFKPESCDQVYLKKYGDCKGMANLMKAMLSSIGYDARLTWLGTNSVPYSYEEHCLASDNHMICTVILNGKKYYLDATETNVSFGDNAQRIQGRQVLIEDGDKYELATIPVTKDLNKIVRKYSLKVDQEKLVGQVNLGFEGEGKRYFLNRMQNLRSEYKEKALENLVSGGMDGILPSNIELSDVDDREADVSVSSTIEIDYQVQVVNAKTKGVYLDLLSTGIGTNEIDTNRRFAYNVGIKGDYITELSIKTRNAKMLSKHESFEVKTNDFVYKLSFKPYKSSVKVTKTIQLLNPTIQIENIKEWNAAVKQMQGELNKVILFN